MIKYSLLNVPNQQFAVSVNGHNAMFRFRTFRGIIYVDVTVDDTLKCRSIKAVPNTALLPNDVRVLLGGQFLFSCSEDDYPNYQLMNKPECTFIYVTTEEMNE